MAAAGFCGLFASASRTAKSVIGVIRAKTAILAIPGNIAYRLVMRRIGAVVIHLVIAVTAIVVTIATVIRQVIAVPAMRHVIKNVLAIRRAIFAIQVARHAIGVTGAINASIMTRALPATAKVVRPVIVANAIPVIRVKQGKTAPGIISAMFAIKTAAMVAIPAISAIRIPAARPATAILVKSAIGKQFVRCATATHAT